ncbi:MAG: FtsX-like permease family protein [Planctomycetaceae bacterium]|nr:FtsX-like permease family protein [Planctomycetaceae bacterium]
MKHISLLLCLRYLQHRRIVLLSVAAVALSCALLIVTDSLFTGFIQTIESSVGSHLGDIVLEAPAGSLITDYDVLVDSLVKTNEVEAATAVLSSQGLLLTAPGKAKGVQVWGIELPRRLAVTPLQRSLLRQKTSPPEQVGFDVPGQPDVIGGIIGIGVAAGPDEVTDEYDMTAVKALIGSRMTLTTGSVIESKDAEGNEPAAPRLSRKVIRFSLADVAMTGVYDFDKSFVMLPLEALSQSLYPDQPVSANLVHIRLAPGADQDESLKVVQGVWRDFGKGRFDWYMFAQINSSKQMQAYMIREYKKQMGVLLLIFGLVSLGIILLVFCVFYLIVMTRRKDIGILKSCGLSSPSVAAMFVLFGAVVGIVGASAGVGLGWLIIRHINEIEHVIAAVFHIKLWKASTYMFTQIPNVMHWGSVLWVTLAGIGAAAAGSLIPAAAAARVKPVHTLQYE